MTADAACQAHTRIRLPDPRTSVIEVLVHAAQIRSDDLVQIGSKLGDRIPDRLTAIDPRNRGSVASRGHAPAS